MKKTVSYFLVIILTFVSVIFVSSCSGYTQIPTEQEIKEETGRDLFTRDYIYGFSYDEEGEHADQRLAEDIRQYYTGSNEQNEILKNNESVQTLFSRDYVAYQRDMKWDMAGWLWTSIWDDEYGPMDVDTFYQLLKLFYSESEIANLPMDTSIYYCNLLGYETVQMSGLFSIPCQLLFMRENLFDLITDDIKYNFKNPDSLIIYEIDIYGLYLDWKEGNKYPTNRTLFFECNVGSENSFGAMVQEDIYVSYSYDNFNYMTNDRLSFSIMVSSRIGHIDNLSRK